jgi:hypothetical protein
MTQIVYPLRAKMTTTTTGTGIITLGSAVGGFSSFSDALSASSYIKYTIEDADGGWEVGTGYCDISAGTLGRDPHASSNSGTTITLSGNAVVYATTSHHEVASRQLIASGTVSNQANLSYDWKLGTSGLNSDGSTKFYSKYELLLDRLTPVSDARIYLRIRYGSSTFSNSTSTSSIYQGQYMEAQSTTDYAQATTTSVHYLSRYTTIGGAASESGWSGSITFMTDRDEYGVAQFQQINSLGGYISSAGAPVTHQAFTEYGSSTVDIQGFYLYASTGNLDTGKWSLYGVRD